MSIQSNINQSISLMSLLISNNPEVRQKSERRVQLKEAQAGAEKYEKMAESGATIADRVEELSPEGAPAEYKADVAERVAAAQTLVAETGEKAYRKLYELDPSEKTYRDYEAHAGGTANIAREKKRYVSSLRSSPTETAHEMASRAEDAGKAEAERLAASRTLDLSLLDERTIGRVERAYRRAERDTKHLTKRGGSE